MTTVDRAKQDARILKAYLKSKGIDISHSAALEAIARLAREKSWAKFLAVAKTTADLSPSAGSIRKWPKYVFFFEQEENDDSEDSPELLYFLPLGASLSDPKRLNAYGDINDVDAIQSFYIPTLGKIAVTSVHAMCPNVSKYGLPDYAHQATAVGWFRDKLKMGTVDSLEVTFRNTGDDSGSRYWFEAHVDPEVAHQLRLTEALVRAGEKVLTDIGGIKAERLNLAHSAQASGSTASAKAGKVDPTKPFFGCRLPEEISGLKVVDCRVPEWSRTVEISGCDQQLLRWLERGAPQTGEDEDGNPYADFSLGEPIFRYFDEDARQEAPFTAKELLEATLDEDGRFWITSGPLTSQEFYLLDDHAEPWYPKDPIV